LAGWSNACSGYFRTVVIYYFKCVLSVLFSSSLPTLVTIVSEVL
jgi:hypothetical protein